MEQQIQMEQQTQKEQQIQMEQQLQMEQQIQIEQQTPKYVHGLYYCSDPRVMCDVTVFLNKIILSSSLTNTYFIWIQ